MGLIYLASPIDFAGAEAARKVEVEVWAAEEGHTLYDPSAAFKLAGADAGVQTVNRYALDHADAVVAVLPEAVVTHGVPAEVEYALVTGKPVAVLADVGGVALADWRARGAVADLDSLEVGRVVGLRVVVEPNGRMPSRQHDDDTGWDLYVSDDVSVAPGEWKDVPCGVRVELPKGWWAMLTGRSSTLRRRGLLVSTGIIDHGYRGPLWAGVINVSKDQVVVRRDERIAQLIPFEHAPVHWMTIRTDQLGDHPRGEAGFGSSGR